MLSPRKRGYAVDRDQGLANLRVDRCARGVWLCHIAGVDFIHGGEVGEVGKEDLYFDDILPGRAGGIEQGGDVLEYLDRLFLERGCDDLAGLRIEGALRGDEYEGPR